MAQCPRFLRRFQGGRVRFAASWAVGHGFATLAQFAVAVATARLLGASGRGELTAWTLVAVFGGPLLSFGVPEGLGLSALRGERGQVGTALRHAAWVLALAAVAGAVAIGLGASPAGVLLFLILGVPAAVLLGDGLTLLQAVDRPWLFHVARAGGSVVALAGIGIVVSAGLDDRDAWVWLPVGLGFVLGPLFIIAALRRDFGLRRGPPLARAGREGLPSWPRRMSDQLLLRADQYVVAFVTGTAGLGVYGLAVNLSEVVQGAGYGIGQTVFGSQASLTPAHAWRILRTTFVAVLALALVAAVAAIALVPLVFGDEFKEMRLLLLLLAPGAAARAVVYAADTMLVARGAGGLASIASAVALALALVLWTAGALLGDIQGAALANTVVYLLHAGFVTWLLARVFRGEGDAPSPRTSPAVAGPPR